MTDNKYIEYLNLSDCSLQDLYFISNSKSILDSAIPKKNGSKIKTLILSQNSLGNNEAELIGKGLMENNVEIYKILKISFCTVDYLH